MPVFAAPERLGELMRRDQKARTGLTCVLDGPRGVEVVTGVPASEVLATLAEVQS